VDVGQTELLLGTDLEPALNSFPETDEADTGAETARQVLSPLVVAQIAVPQPANVRSPRSVGGIVNQHSQVCSPPAEDENHLEARPPWRKPGKPEAAPPQAAFPPTPPRHSKGALARPPPQKL